MTADGEYQRVLGEHGWRAKAGRCSCRWRPSHAIAQFPDPPTPPLFEQYSAHVARALAADPGVRAAVEREARAEAWDEGHRYCELRRLAHGKCVNPYRQEPSNGE